MATTLFETLVRGQEDEEAAPVACGGGNEYDGRMGLRVSSIFVILVGATLGAWFPIFARRKNLGMPEWCFFVAKYFGSGVIIATAFIHLLGPAEEALRNECLTGVITEYSWVEGIVLMTVMAMFVVELLAMRYGQHSAASKSADLRRGRTSDGDPDVEHREKYKDDLERSSSGVRHIPGEDHLGHARSHVDITDAGKQPHSSHHEHSGGFVPETYATQLTSIFILEFGIIFHSVFIGLTLAVAGAEFATLYVVLTFHQTFEGLGLGSRLSTVPWPRHRRWTAYALAVGYGFSTPIAIAVGLGVRSTLDPGSASFLLVNGVFDSISAGILIYTGLVELMAHEFMFSPQMQSAPLSEVFGAIGLMFAGAGLMALLGKWA